MRALKVLKSEHSNIEPMLAMLRYIREDFVGRDEFIVYLLDMVIYELCQQR